jgi:hypothetical protein
MNLVWAFGDQRLRNKIDAQWATRRLTSIFKRRFAVKHLTGLGLIIGLLGLPVPSQAQVLTSEATDCALAMIAFRASAVTGLNLIVPPETLPRWRGYLANRYPTLPDRYSVANACWGLNNVMTKWPQMPPVEHELWQNMWAASLPQDLAFIEPVFPAGAQQLRAALQRRTAQQWRAAPQNAVPSATQNTEAEAIAELNRRSKIGSTLQQFWQSYHWPK